MFCFILPVSGIFLKCEVNSGVPNELKNWRFAETVSSPIDVFGMLFDKIRLSSVFIGTSRTFGAMVVSSATNEVIILSISSKSTSARLNLIFGLFIASNNSLTSILIFC
ncbi:hypothetical protein ES708_15515 [subsurface metagenome]